MIEREYVTLTEAARYLGVSLGAVRLWVYTHKTLPSYKVGRRRMIRRGDLETFPVRSPGPAREGSNDHQEQSTAK